MISHILKRTVVTDNTLAHFCQVVCSVMAALVMVLGIRRIAVLDFTEAEQFSAITGVLVLTGVFISLGFLCRAWRRS